LSARGIACPAISEVPVATGCWLLKPRHGAGGFGIQPYAGKSFNPSTHFLQERIDGPPCSAIFLGHERCAFCYGATQQLIGVPWLNATGFHYAGNVGPLPLDSATVARWHQLGSALASFFGLRGLFGVDAIMRDGVPWPVEINPRYTASVELLERSYKKPLLTAHRATFEQMPLPTLAIPARPPVWGKAILYARKTLSFPREGPWREALQQDVDLDRSEYADIPHTGEVILQGRPVLTLFASAATTAECLERLQEKAQALDRRLCG
jgi:uncharacterized protein